MTSSFTDTIQRVCVEYAHARSSKRKDRALRFCGKTFRIFEDERLNDVKWGQGCFASGWGACYATA
jgi:hypothetical protein